MGKVKYETGYISSAILWGDRYAAESPDEILTRITKAKAAGAAQAILQSLHIEYLETVYENNPLELREQMIYYIGEPYFFFSVADVLTWPQIPQIQLIEKQMWGEFICTLTKQDIAAIPDEDIPGTVAKIYRDWVIKKYTADKQMDALLFANDGSQLVIGDNARVKVNLAKDPKDLGKTFKVDNIVTGKNGNTVQMSCDGVQCEYMSNELERVF
jgi:hypothetical protein